MYTLSVRHQSTGSKCIHFRLFITKKKCLISGLETRAESLQ